jgi:hypothetical protein
MTFRPRSRKRSPGLRFALALWAVVLAVALAVTVWHVIGWIAATVAAGAACYVIGRRGQAPPRMPQIRRAALGPSERRARANGWTPPGRSVLLAVSAECAGGECVWCHDARCEHDCGHPSQRPAPIRAPLPDKPPF